MLRHSSVRVPRKDHQSQRRTRKGSEKKNFKRSNCLPRKRVDTTTDTRGKPLGVTQNRMTIEPRQLRAISSTAEIIKENRSSEVCSQGTCCSKRSRVGTDFCRCGKKLGGWTAAQEKNAQVTDENGCQFTQSLVQQLPNKSNEANAMAHEKIRYIGL